MGQRFPAVSESRRIEMLRPPAKRPVRMVLDTDTFNEIDDQFAVVYALISPELDVQAIYAAPFHNNRSSGPGDGMEKSYEEILRVLDKLGKSPEGFAFKGSTNWIKDVEKPERSPCCARSDRAGEEEQPAGPAVCRGGRGDHQRRQRDPDRALDHPEHRRGLAGRQRAQLAAARGNSTTCRTSRPPGSSSTAACPSCNCPARPS